MGKIRLFVGSPESLKYAPPTPSSAVKLVSIVMIFGNWNTIRSPVGTRSIAAAVKSCAGIVPVSVAAVAVIVYICI